MPLIHTRYYIAIGLATVAVTGFLFAMAAHIPLPQKCKVSDLIAVVEITTTESDGAPKPFHEVATARVVEKLDEVRKPHCAIRL